MRFVSSFSRITLLTVVMISVVYSAARAQQIEMPDGEAIVAVNTFSGTDVCRLSTTRTTIYSSKYSGGVWSKGKQLYQTNPARRIVDAAFKSGEVGDTRSYVILLDNGETMVFSYNGSTETFAAPIVYPSPLIPQGNAAYRKVLFADDISVQFGTTFYRNLRDGSVWKQDTAGLTRLTIADITLDSYDAVLAATNKGVWKFDPMAGSWSRVGAKADTISIASIFGSRNGRVFASTATRSTWVSADRGATWTRDSAGIGVAAITRFSDDIGNTVYATTGGNNSQLYRKTAAGNSWERIDAGLKTFAVSNVQNLRITDLSGETTLEVGTAWGCYTGTSNGDSWAYSSLGIMAEDIYGIQFLGNATVVSTGLGVYRKQGTTWTKVFPSVGFSGTRPLYRSDKAGISYFQLAATGGGTGGQQIGLIYASTDNGATWTLDTAGLSAVPVSTSNFFGSVFYADRGGRKHIINSSGTGVPMRLYSSNPSWGVDTTGMGFTATSTQNQEAVTMHTDFSMANQYVGGMIYNATFTVDASILFKRAYAGGTWNVDTLGLNKSSILAITSGKTNTYCGSAAVNGVSSIFRKTPMQWEKLPSPPSAVSDVRALSVDSNGVLYVAYSPVISQNVPNRGCYATTDNGTTWLYAGLDSVAVRGLVATSDAVYAFTSRGTYKLTLQGLKAASILISSHAISFNKIPIGKTEEVDITISNYGNDTLRVTGFRSSNQQITAFSVVPSQFNLAPAQTLAAKVRFAPTTAGIVSTTLRSVGNTLPDTILVIGEGLKPNAEIQFVSKAILFDAVTVGKFADSVIDVSNSGTDTLRVTNVVSTNPVFTCTPKSFIVVPGGKTQITLRFTPTTATSQNGEIRFTTNIGTDSIAVFGTGDVSSVRENEFAQKINMTVTPNPSAEQASVSFALKNYGEVTLNIVNSLGETIGSVYKGSLEAGEHTFPIHFTNNGVYFVRLSTVNGIATVKVVSTR
jgi:hypothetical protein